MNRTASSSKSNLKKKKKKKTTNTTTTTSPCPKSTTKKAATTTCRNPLSDLRSNSNTQTHFTNSSISVETPKAGGCLPFFPSKSKRFSKTPKSAPISKFISKPPISQKSTRLLNKSENDKDCFHCPKSDWKFSRSIDEEGNNAQGSTPIPKQDTTPPPVQLSISPEIQCGSSFMSSDSSCFGAGHLLSGVTDRRKCRPRGVLVVDEIKDSGLFKDAVSPIEASMHWLSPTRVEESEQKESVVNGCNTPSSISGNGESTSIFDLDSGGSLTLSPRKNSLSSGGDSFASYNAVCTPKSDSSLDDRVGGSSWFDNTKGSMFEFDSLSSGYSAQSLSPKNRSIKGNAADVLPLPGFSFQFSQPNRLSPHFVDQNQLQKDSNDSWVDSSNMRVSWRDGLVSRMLEMEDLDCCRVFSDEEDEIGCKANENVVQDPIAGDIAVPEEVVFKEPKTVEQQNVKVLENSSSCAESISTEGGGLTTSRDSDWDQCYKNQPFTE